MLGLSTNTTPARAAGDDLAACWLSGRSSLSGSSPARDSSFGLSPVHRLPHALCFGSWRWNVNTSRRSAGQAHFALCKRRVAAKAALGSAGCQTIQAHQEHVLSAGWGLETSMQRVSPWTFGIWPRAAEVPELASSTACTWGACPNSSWRSTAVGTGLFRQGSGDALLLAGKQAEACSSNLPLGDFGKAGPHSGLPDLPRSASWVCCIATSSFGCTCIFFWHLSWGPPKLPSLLIMPPCTAACACRRQVNKQADGVCHKVHLHCDCSSE